MRMVPSFSTSDAWGCAEREWRMAGGYATFDELANTEPILIATVRNAEYESFASMK